MEVFTVVGWDLLADSLDAAIWGGQHLGGVVHIEDAVEFTVDGEDEASPRRALLQGSVNSRIDDVVSHEQEELTVDISSGLQDAHAIPELIVVIAHPDDLQAVEIRVSTELCLHEIAVTTDDDDESGDTLSLRGENRTL